MRNIRLLIWWPEVSLCIMHWATLAINHVTGQKCFSICEKSSLAEKNLMWKHSNHKSLSQVGSSDVVRKSAKRGRKWLTTACLPSMQEICGKVRAKVEMVRTMKWKQITHRQMKKLTKTRKTNDLPQNIPTEDDNIFSIIELSKSAFLICLMCHFFFNFQDYNSFWSDFYPLFICSFRFET